tara:strand:- start:121995 stop:122504 length:510 start_codon:yes stop_codon:yes gene_type:complete
MVRENEYHPYFKSYIDTLLKNGKSIVENMIDSGDELDSILSNISKEKESYVYEEGKWTIKELLQHVIDTERIFNYRALRFARNDQTSIEGFEQDDYNDNVDANSRDFTEMLEEFKIARKNSIMLFKSFSEEALLRMGPASGNMISVRALGFLISGHQIHHIKVFQERYL